MADKESDAVAFVIDNWDALGVQENDGVLHLPASIKRRNKSGGIDEVAVMLRNVTNQHRFRARVQAREFALKLKFELDRDAHLVDQLENYALLAYAIRDPKTFDQHVIDVEALVARYDTQALTELWGRYNVWVEMLDPRFGELSAEQLWQVIVRVAKERTPAPLVSMPGPAQFTCIVLMALEALRSPNRPSWLQSSEISKAAS